MGDLVERLRNDAKAFEGLVGLHPPKHHADRLNLSDSGRKKKPTKADRKAEKQAKSEPNAHEVTNEAGKDRKRKREPAAGDGHPSNPGAVRAKEAPELPQLKRAKRQNLDREDADREADNPGNTPDMERNKREDAIVDETERGTDLAKPGKAQRKEEKRLRLEARKERKKVNRKKRLSEAKAALGQGDSAETAPKEEVGVEEMNGDDVEAIDISGLTAETENGRDSSSNASPAPESLFSNQSVQPSASSNTSLDIPAKETEENSRPKLPKIDTEVLKERLKARIEALRAARKADGPDGRPARNRQELLEARRKKAEQRKQHKKEMRKQAREEEDQLKAEEELAKLRGSGSPLSVDIFSPARTASPDTNFAFGRVAFKDGQHLDTSMSNLFDGKKRKGPSDPRTALEAAERKRQRLAALDEGKRADISEKDTWLNAKKKANGERVRDDVNLLKKTLKRKEKTKARSERQWNDRNQGVEKAKDAKQRKREENLAKRREEKGARGKKKKPPPAKKKPVRRPGFEGSFRSKARR